jgi:hypothetical protein
LITSSSLSNGAMWQQGLKISSVVVAALSDKPVQMVGSI